MKVHTGGLFRCCIATLEKRNENFEVGAVVKCDHCQDGIRLDSDGIWRWAKLEEAKDGEEANPRG